MPRIPLQYIVIAWQHLLVLKTLSIMVEPNTLIYGYHYIQDMEAQNEVVLKHVSTSLMIADPLKKPIGRDVFQAHVRSLGLRRI